MMSPVFDAILPICLLLMLGNLARRSGFLVDSFWVQAEKGTYFVLFPCLLVQRLSQAEIDFQATLPLVFLSLLTPVLAGVLVFIVQYFRPWSGADFTSVFQGAIRFNSYMGLSLVVSLLPPDYVALAVIVMAVMIPWLNVLCILVFARYTDGDTSMSKTLQNVFKNPLIIGCLLGISLNILSWELPPTLNTVMGWLGDMTLPLGLLCVGAGLRLKALRYAGSALAYTSFIKLLLLPLCIGLLTWALQLDPKLGLTMVLFAALPTASSAYILAKQLGGNAELMAVIITGQTLLALLSLSLVLWLLV